MVPDPYKYFRIEARELLDGLNQGVLELERGAAHKPIIGRLLRFAHTLKGASRVVKLAHIAEKAHAVEDVLGPHRETEAALATSEIDRLLDLLDSISSAITAIDNKSEVVPGVPAAAFADQQFETVRVDIGEMDTIIEGVAEAMTHLGGLRGASAELERARNLAQVLSEQLSPRRTAELSRLGATAALAKSYSVIEELKDSLESADGTVSGRIEQIATELLQVRDAASRLRLHPVSSVLGALERAARDAAQALGKKVAFKSAGGEIRVDAPILLALRDALLHVIRNAVAHGVETEAERVLAGKPPVGELEISVERRGNRAAFSCRDDGRGVDIEALRGAAVRSGVLSATQARALGREQVIQLLLQGGLTTSDTVSQLSGRGIGLDVVRETAQRLNGEVKIQSESGRGTAIEICVPISLSSLPVLTIQAAGVTASLPLDAVRATLRLADTEIAKTSAGESIVHDGKPIPFRVLAELLAPRAQSAARAIWSVVVLEAGTAQLALGVDRLLGTATSVMKSLPSWTEAERIVAGAAFDTEGTPQIVLDPVGLIAVSHGFRRAAVDTGTQKRPLVLIVDDSLTTRMLEQSILESAGYKVELATSAEEALGKAADTRYGLFIVDVEMPGMDGFEFVTRTRQDPVLRDIPAILVTSRGSPEDRQRGKQAGAHAYIVKGEFDQTFLLQTIRELIG